MDNNPFAISDTQIVERIGKLNNLKLYKSDGHYYLTDTSKKTTLETRAELYLHLLDNITDLRSTDPKLFDEFLSGFQTKDSYGYTESYYPPLIVGYESKDPAKVKKAYHILALAQRQYDKSGRKAVPNDRFILNMIHILANKNYLQ
jgi:hypothetical protein